MQTDPLYQSLMEKAETGDREARYELSWRLSLGMGLEQDEAEGVSHLLAAANEGHPLAQNNLGARHLAGDGVAQDVIEAFKWFHLAAGQGDRKAGKNRDSVCAQLSDEQLKEGLRRVTVQEAKF